MYLPGPTCARLFVCSDVSTLFYVSVFSSLAWSLSHGAQQLVGDVQVQQKGKKRKTKCDAVKRENEVYFCLIFLATFWSIYICSKSLHKYPIQYECIFFIGATPQQSIFFPMFCLQRQLFHLMFTLFFGIVFALLLNCSALLEQRNGCSEGSRARLQNDSE